MAGRGKGTAATKEPRIYSTIKSKTANRKTYVIHKKDGYRKVALKADAQKRAEIEERNRAKPGTQRRVIQE